MIAIQWSADIMAPEYLCTVAGWSALTPILVYVTQNDSVKKPGGFQRRALPQSHVLNV